MALFRKILLVVFRSPTELEEFCESNVSRTYADTLSLRASVLCHDIILISAANTVAV